MHERFKFRAWDKQDNRMSNVLALHLSGLNERRQYAEVNNCVVTTFPELDRIELLQFTGLADKNGKEIYEGDIVKYSLPGEKKEDGEIEYIERVEYSGSCFCIDETIPLDAFNEIVEIIGNIFENPELLK